MFLDLFLSSFPLALSTLLGISFLNLFFPKIFKSFFEKLGICFGLGLGLVTIIETVFLVLRVQITPFNFYLTMAFLITVMSLFSKKDSSQDAKVKGEYFNLISRIMVFLMIANGIWVILKAFNLPMFSDDAVTSWGLKAKAIYFANLSGDSFTAMAGRMRYTGCGNYPLLVSLAENYVNIFSSAWNDFYPKIISPFYYFSLLLAFFWFLRRFTKKNYALIFTFLLSSLPFLANSANDAMADLPFAYYYVISSLLILLWIKDRQNLYLYLSAIFMGFSIWTKSEGYALFLVNLTVILFFIIFNLKSRGKDLFRGLSVYLLIVIPVILLILYYQHLTGVEEQTMNRQALSFIKLIKNLDRVPFILYQLQMQFFGTFNRWNLLGYLFTFALLMNLKKSFTSFYPYLLLMILLNFVVYTAFFVLTPLKVDYHMMTTQNRILMHFNPLMLFFAALSLYPQDFDKE